MAGVTRRNLGSKRQKSKAAAITMLALNCVNARSRLQAESELEEASKRVEEAFTSIQLRELKRGQVETAIKDARAKKVEEIGAHLEWLQREKARLESELGSVDEQLAEKRRQLSERSG